MSTDEPAAGHSKAPEHTWKQSTSRVRDLFALPAPVKRVFDNFPMLTYAPNELPARAPRRQKKACLYVFSSEADARAGRPSFNPSCLKWQTFLKIAGVDHDLVSSNNHASPTGVLPFLLPACSTSSQSSMDAPLPIPSNKLSKYAAEHGEKVEESPSIRYEAYQSLIDHRIRNAWLYTLYLEPRNFSALAEKLYVNSVTSSILVRKTISHQLQTAAESELLKHSAIIDVDDIYSEADKAFDALEILLGEDNWFFGEASPTLFDASVFAYTHLLLDEKLEWKEKRLVRSLRTRQRLVKHREKLLSLYYNES